MEYINGHAIYSVDDLANLELEKVFELIKTDEFFKEDLLNGIDNFANSWTDADILHAFQGRKWNFKEVQKFESGDRQCIAYWFNEYVQARQKLENKQSFKDAEEADRLRREKRLMTYALQIPEEHSGCSVEDFTGDGHKMIIDGVLNKGKSFILCGPRGIGKTRLGWALWLALKMEDKKTVDFMKMFELQKILLNSSLNGTQMVDFINAKYVYGLDVLILDEVDKISMTDASFANFSYLIDRRYEEHKQTIMFGNGDKTSIEEQLGSSMISRFNSKSYKSKLLVLSGNDKRNLDNPS